MRHRNILYGVIDIETGELVIEDEDTNLPYTGYNKEELEELIAEAGQLGVWKVEPLS